MATKRQRKLKKARPDSRRRLLNQRARKQTTSSNQRMRQQASERSYFLTPPQQKLRDQTSRAIRLGIKQIRESQRRAK